MPNPPIVETNIAQLQLDLNPERRREFVAALNIRLTQARARHVEACRTGSGLAACAAYASELDALLSDTFKWLIAETQSDATAGQRIAVIAQGGYGRGHMNLHSDIDLLFLLPENPTPTEHALVRSFLYILWDLPKVDVGYAARKPAETLLALGMDLDSTTALMATRLVAGDAAAHAALSSRFLSTLGRSHRRWFVESKIAETQTRHEKLGSTVYLLEPNLKDSEGGLRDVQSLGWLSQALLGSSALDAVVDAGILTAAETRTLEESLDFMLRARTFLHECDGRKVDVLAFDKQRRVAEALGYTGDAVLLAEEKMMQDYYFHARDNQRLWRKAVRRFVVRDKWRIAGIIDRVRSRTVAPGFYVKDKLLFAKDEITAQYFRNDPPSVMRVFDLACSHDAQVSDELKEIMTEARDGLDNDAFRSSHECRDYFMKILSRKGCATRTLHDMHETRILHDYMPEFRKLYCLARIDYYHRYTVDEHLIRSVGMAEELLSRDTRERAELVAAAQEIRRWDLLTLALLLHDIGKGEGHGHVLRGAMIAEQMTLRMGLPAEDRETVRQLVLLHLRMAHMSQRRDLEDPAVITDMASNVGNPELLRMLYVLTACDTKAVGPNTWNDWKASLLQALFFKTMQVLEGRTPKPEDAEKRLTNLAARIRELAAPEISSEEIDDFVRNMPAKYLNVVTPERMHRHMMLLRRVDAANPLLYEVDTPPGLGYTEITCASRDRPGIMGLLCGALSARSLNILSVQAFSTKDGHVVDTFQVTDLKGQVLPAGMRFDRMMTDLYKVLDGKGSVQDVLKPARRQPTSTRDVSMVKPPQILVDRETSPNYTIVEVKAHDRPGLLYDITSVCAQQRINIHQAMITTEAYRVVDVFYVTDLDYNKLEPTALKKLVVALEEVMK